MATSSLSPAPLATVGSSAIPMSIAVSLLTPNSTTTATSPALAPEWQPAFVGSFYFLLALPSFLLHVLVFLSIWRTQNGPRKFTPFYILLTNHYLADVIKTLFYILYACPCIWARAQVYGVGAGDILGEFESVDYCAVLFSTFFISVNRALAIGAPALNEKLFTKKLALSYNAMCWLGGAGVSAINRWLSCRTVLLETRFVFSTICVEKPAASPGSIIVYIFAYGVIVFYLFALGSLAKTRRQLGDDEGGSSTKKVGKNMRGYQLRLFLQAMGIWMGVVGNAIAFRIIPLFQPGLGTVLATGTVIIGQSYITPLCNVVFVKDIRDGTKLVFTRGDNMVTALSNKSNTGQRQQQKQQGGGGRASSMNRR